jgi:ribulose-phosphate 3-epimerase
MQLEIIPAILAKSKEELLEKIAKVRPYVKTVQIDIMDGKFVNNKTIDVEDLAVLPPGLNYEFHWMINEPHAFIRRISGDHLHIVHIEALKSFDWVLNAIKKAGGRLALALNPETPLERILPFVDNVECVVVMTVHPGFSAQQYIQTVEGKIEALRAKYEKLDIEVDGGINKTTIGRAMRAGANKFAVASAIFSAESVGEAIRELKQALEEESYG